LLAAGLLLAWFCLLSQATYAGVPYSLCGIDIQQFMKFAFPSNSSSGIKSLYKWDMVPNLIVLSPDERIRALVAPAFDQIAKDNIVPGSQLVFRTYGSAEEIFSLARYYGLNNVFVVVDAAAFSDEQERASLRQQVADIVNHIPGLLTPEALVDGLFADAKWSGYAASRVGTRNAAAMVQVVLVNPRVGTKDLASTVYLDFLLELAPTAAFGEPTEYFSAAFDSQSQGAALKLKLSEFGKSFLQVMLDPAVRAGAKPEDFQACPN
jgi:hypothetical protein